MYKPHFPCLVGLAGILFQISAICEGMATMLSQADIIEEVKSKHPGEQIPKFEELATLPPNVAWRAYGRFYRGYAQKYPGSIREAALAIANNSSVESWIKAKLQEGPYDDFDSGYRSRDIELLGSIPAAWSVRVLGGCLFDDRPFKEYGDSRSTPPNPHLAAWALTKMGFFDDPTKAPLLAVTTEDVLSGWRDWWNANETRIEERIKEINPNYAPHSTAVVEKSVEIRRSSPTPPILPQTATASKEPILASDNLSSLLFIGGTLLAIIGIGLAVEWRRRHPKRHRF